MFIDGYFQCEKYFCNIRSILLKEFTLKSSLSSYSSSLKKNIESFENTVSLHVRRGDYVSNKVFSDVHGTCNLDYYKKAIEYISKEFEDIKFFVFSDDIAWTKENIDIENVIYVDSEENRIPHEDMYLMSLCSHNIIANSSFSWWGAWLNQNNEKIVIAPKRWFSDDKMQNQSLDIVPSSWIRI